MTAEIVLQVFRFGFLLLLWLFIFAAFRVVRADLLGGLLEPRPSGLAFERRGWELDHPESVRSKLEHQLAEE